MLKSELPYYEACNSGDIPPQHNLEVFKYVFFQLVLKCSGLGLRVRTEATLPKENNNIVQKLKFIWKRNQKGQQQQKRQSLIIQKDRVEAKTSSRKTGKNIKNRNTKEDFKICA